MLQLLILDGVTTPNPTILLDGTTGIGTVSVSPTVNTTYSLVSIATSGTPVCTTSFRKCFYYGK